MPKRLIVFSQKPSAIKAIFDADKYMSFEKLTVDTVCGNFEAGVNKKSANSKIRQKIYEVLELSDAPTEYEVKRALNNTAKREAFFEIVTDTVQDTLVSGWGANPFFNAYLEIKNGTIGERNEFYIPDTTDLIITKVAKGNHNLIRQRLGAGHTASVDVDSYGAKIYSESLRYLTQAEDWAKFINKISVAYTKVINTLVHNALLGAGAKLPSPERWTKTMELIPENHDAMIELISDVSAITGSSVVIMGTKTALSGLPKMGNVTTMSASEKEDIYHNGVSSYFEGTPLVEIPQSFERTDAQNYLVDNKKLLIMPTNIEKFIKLYYEGAETVREVTDANTNRDASMEYELLMTFGIAILTNVRFGTWVIGA